MRAQRTSSVIADVLSEGKTSALLSPSGNGLLNLRLHSEVGIHRRFCLTRILHKILREGTFASDSS